MNLPYGQIHWHCILSCLSIQGLLCLGLDVDSTLQSKLGTWILKKFSVSNYFSSQCYFLGNGEVSGMKSVRIHFWLKSGSVRVNYCRRRNQKMLEMLNVSFRYFQHWNVSALESTSIGKYQNQKGLASQSVRMGKQES